MCKYWIWIPASLSQVYSIREQNSVCICGLSSWAQHAAGGFLICNSVTLSLKPYHLEMMPYLADEKTDSKKLNCTQIYNPGLSTLIFCFRPCCSYLAGSPAFGSLVLWEALGSLGEKLGLYGVILLASVDFHFGFICGPLPLHCFLSCTALYGRWYCLSFCGVLQFCSPGASFL